jgi:hypothetical protein
VTGDAGAEAAGAAARVPRPVRMLAAAAVVIAVLAVGAWLFWPGLDGRDEGVGAGGGGRIGAAPGDPMAGTGNAPPSASPGAPGASPGVPGVGPPPGGGPIPAVTVAPPATIGPPPSIPVSQPPGPGNLVATYTVTRGIQTTVDVVIANVGGTPVTGWTIVMEFYGVDLIVWSDTKRVNHDKKGEQHIFTPTDETLTVPVGASVSFNLVITGVLNGVKSCTIDGRACLVG